MKGRIIKGVGGFYIVRPSNEKKEVMSKARGVFKKEGLTPLVGDYVEWDMLQDNTGIITDIYDRKNSFIRPSVSNIDILLIVMAFDRPLYDMRLLDKLIVTAEQALTDPVIIFNKMDLEKPGDRETINNIYKDLYPLYFVKGLTGEGIEEVRKTIKGKTSALTGQSGVGKSTILNRIFKEEKAETGIISHKSKRGKHTTRHVEIFLYDEDTEILDTPGFSSFETSMEDGHRLSDYFIDINRLQKDCRFRDCKHVNEPGCRVIEAVKEGDLSESRYSSYLEQLKERELFEKERFK